MRKIYRFILTFSLLLVLTLWFMSGVFAQTPTPAPQIRITQVDNSKFPQVTVYVSVTDANGQPVGVDPSAIQISENGQVMKTTTSATSVNGQTTKGPGQLTTLLVIDISGSMATANKLTQAKAAADAYVNQMRPGDQAGVVAFDTHVSVVQSITTDHQALTNAIDSLQPGTDTAMFDALINAEQLLANVSGRKAIVLLTDGMDNRSKNTEDAAVKAIGSGGLTISTIGLGNPQDVKSLQGIDETSLKSLAQQAGGIYTYEPDPSQLSSIFQQYGTALQNEYAITYTSLSTLRDGVNRNLTVSLNGSTVTTQSQYNPGGVLPEVAGQNWMLFGGMLIVLLVLLAIPMLVNLVRRSTNRGIKKGRIRFAGQANNPAQSGRVKLK
jgi:Ca-activated chloride channel homolog